MDYKYFRFIKEQMDTMVPAFARHDWTPERYIDEWEARTQKVNFSYEDSKVFIEAVIEMARAEVQSVRDDLRKD